MIENKECRKKFNNIVKCIENQGYIDWKRWVIEQVKDYDEEKLLNLVKRNEIKLKRTNQADIGMFPIAVQFSAIFLMLMHFVGTVIMTAFNILINSYNSVVTLETIKEFTALICDNIMEMGMGLIKIGGGYASFVVILLVMAKGFDTLSLKRQSDSKIYYEELVAVLKDELEKKQC